MADDILSLSDDFPGTDEAEWLAAVSQALKGGDIGRLTQTTRDGITIRPLYREADWASASDPSGMPGSAPFLRGADAVRDPYLPWDIRQTVTHPDPRQAHDEIVHDLENGVSSIELAIDPTGDRGCTIASIDELDMLMHGIQGNLIVTALLNHGTGNSTDIEAACLLADWSARQDSPALQKPAFNLDPLGSLARLGLLEESLTSAFARRAALAHRFARQFPLATIFRIDACHVHEAGGSEAQEIGAMIAHAVDTVRRLDQAGLAPADSVPRIIFTLAIGANYGLEIAKLRAARRLWARCLEALELEPQPMKLQAVTSARMQTKRDPWVNILRNAAACFAAGVGGADIVTVRPFTDALGIAGSLGRRIARNTQLIAQEECGLGKVADMAGGAWFTETLADDLARAAWTQFQRIESEGGYGASLMAGAFQSRVAEARAKLRREIATRAAPITGVSEFALLDEIEAPIADLSGWQPRDMPARPDLPPDLPAPEGECLASPLWPMRTAEPYERLRDLADLQTRSGNKRPAIFIATLGPLAEYTARAAFARRLFAAGGIEAKMHEAGADPAAAFKSSGARIAVLCGTDVRYADEAETVARALKEAGVQRLYLAGKPGEHEEIWRAAGIDSFIHSGVDVIATLELAHAELGLNT